MIIWITWTPGAPEKQLQQRCRELSRGIGHLSRFRLRLRAMRPDLYIEAHGATEAEARLDADEHHEGEAERLRRLVKELGARHHE